MSDLTMAGTILAQLGGERFVMMTSATNFIGSADSLTFKLGSNPKRVTNVRVTLTSDGLYDMTFFRIGKGPQSHDGALHGPASISGPSPPFPIEGLRRNGEGIGSFLMREPDLFPSNHFRICAGNCGDRGLAIIRLGGEREWRRLDTSCNCAMGPSPASEADRLRATESPFGQIINERCNKSAISGLIHCTQKQASPLYSFLPRRIR